MAHVLQLSDGTTTVNFLNECGSSPWCHLEEGGLVIDTPDKKQTWSGSNVWRQGRTLAKHAFENRDIEIVFEIGGSSWDGILNARTAINRLLEKARDAQLRGLNSPVYLQYQLDTATYPVYFDVLDGELELPKDIMSLEKLGWTKCGTDKVLKGCELKLECKPFARGTETIIVSAQSIENADDTSRDSYVSWSGSSIDGDVPGPLRVQYARNYVDSDLYSVYWAGIRDRATPGSMIRVLEIEDADSLYGSPSSQGPSNVYSGTYQKSWTGVPANTDTEVAKWNISSTSSPENYSGRFRVLLVGSSLGTSYLWGIRMKFLVTTLRTYPWRTSGSGGVDILDLGVIELPPWNVDDDQNAGAFSISLYGRFPSTATFALDAIYLVPADDYKFRKWRFRGYHQSNNTVIEDIGVRDQVHYLDSAVYPTGILDSFGLPLHATPGQNGRLYILIMSDTGTYDAQWAGQVTVYHTPYYLDIRGSN